MFAGTTNQDEFRDTTGNRRFWPLLAGKIDIKALERDREMIWAEAVALFKSGERWWPDRDFEQEYIAPEQEARVAIDPWLEPIETWLKLTGRTAPTTFEIARDALTILTSQINSGHHRRVADIMRSLGWVQKARVGNTRPWRKI